VKTDELNITLFGSTVAPRCNARSKRSGEQCCKAAMRGKNVCRMHGGASTRPKTEYGRNRCAKAKTLHGQETRIIRSKRGSKFRELRLVEQTMKSLGMIT